MGRALRAIFLLGTTMALIMVAFTLSTSYQKHTDHVKIIDVHIGYIEDTNQVLLPSKRVSRFLTQTTNQHQHGRSLRPADHCHKDYEVCYLQYGVNSTCCGNKCFDLSTNKQHCGACHNKCKYTYSCCNGQCVDLAYDKRHCGSCSNKCLKGQYCIYGMCDYA